MNGHSSRKRISILILLNNNKNFFSQHFSRKIQMINHPPLFFNENIVGPASLQKHLEMFVDSKSNFTVYLKNIFHKKNKTIRPLHKLQTLLPWPPLITLLIDKLCITPHLDYGDMIYGQTFNMSLQQKMKNHSV